MLTVYGCPNTRSTRVVWALEEAGADYEYVRIDLRAGAGWKPEYLALNSGGKVPTLVDNGFVLTESAAICTYIGDRFPESKLTPPVGSRERASYNRWCYFALSELEQPLWTIAKHQFALPKQRRVPAVLDTARWEFAVAATILADGLGSHDFIIDQSFSAADIVIGHTLAWARVYELPLERDNLRAYDARLRERPALARAKQRERAETNLKD
ncbi:MAG TPA: glutathione S-transferase family protein [Candidatus Competibacter sp.]|nr:glutathione S-transferase family protein [Candidatus Competibacteraceae bacterium]HRE55673.1 glutathione S-transferase family protein [Candidatus Competibacter sp.]HUM92936.1 glutathione S-transferase family protein [Candidatus Competibacter sp.]